MTIAGLQEFRAGDMLLGEYFWKAKIIQASEVTLVSILHRGIVARALEEYPEDRDILMPVLQQQTQHKPQKEKKDKVSRILRERSIFANTSPEFMNAIIKAAVSRVFMPGDRIIEQDAEGTSMFILSLGTASVSHEHFEDRGDCCVRTLTIVGVLPYGSVFGELGMLGVHARRTATIIATSVCCTWEVAQQDCLSLLEEHPAERADFLRLVEEHLDRLAAPRIIYHPLFSCFHQQFRTFLGVNCDRILSFPGEEIVKEGAAGQSLHIMNLGKAMVEIGQQHVMEITSGSYFGFGVMCGTQERYPASVTAKTMCQILVVRAATYRHALQKYPHMVVKAKALEMEEKSRQLKQRIVFEGRIRRRAGIKSIVEALRGVAPLSDNAIEETVDIKESLTESFNAWRYVTQRAARLRKEEIELREGNERQIAAYLQKRQQRMDKTRQRTDLRRLVKQNLEERGPLKLARRTRSHSPSHKMPSEYFQESAHESPYLSPMPMWKRGAMSAREISTRLPPLVAACTPQDMPKASPVLAKSSPASLLPPLALAGTRKRRIITHSPDSESLSEDELS
jgi:CRP-like cAMP-binding protein